MAMSFSGAVLSGISSSFHDGGAKLGGVSAIKVGRKSELVFVASQRKKTLIYAAKEDGNILDGINDATKKAGDFVKEKTDEAMKDGEKTKDAVVEKNSEVQDTVVDEAKKAADFVSEKGKEAGNEVSKFTEGVAADAKDATK